MNMFLNCEVAQTYLFWIDLVVVAQYKQYAILDAVQGYRRVAVEPDTRSNTRFLTTEIHLGTGKCLV